MELLTSLLSHYGLWIVLVGTFLEGETIVVLAGFAAHQGLLDPFHVALLALCGSFAGDQFWFFMARRHRRNRHVQRMTERPGFQRALHFLGRHPTLFILSFRFIYGIRNVSPVVIAFSSVSSGRFVVLNFIAAAIWAATFTALGFIFGNTAEILLGEISRFEHALLVSIAIIVSVYLLYWIGRRIFEQKSPE